MGVVDAMGRRCKMVTLLCGAEMGRLPPWIEGMEELGVVLVDGERRVGGRQYWRCAEHRRTASLCKECGGSQICPHGRQRSRCKECGGSSICPHGRQRNVCKECGGSQICSHGRRRSVCKECGGSSICPHGRVRSTCKECGGSQICPHGRARSRCKECGGSQICPHGRRWSQCKECGGSQICPHGRRRSACKDCGGSEFCLHGRYKIRCPDCTPGYIPKRPFRPRKRMRAPGGVEQAEVHEDCSICLEPLDGELATTPCAHTFHSGCIQDWLWRGAAVRCPLCNGGLEQLATKLNITPREPSSSSSSSSSSDDEDSDGEEDRTGSGEEEEEEEHGDDATARVRELLRFHAPVRFTVDQILTAVPIAARMAAEEWAGLCDQNLHLTGRGTRFIPYRYGWTESSGSSIVTGEDSTTTANTTAAAATTAATIAAGKLERDFLQFKRAIEEWSPLIEEPDDIRKFDC
eukprot:COSAG02_NODE_9119_length_2323_cov_226.028777_2_plen_463_part_00